MFVKKKKVRKRISQPLHVQKYTLFYSLRLKKAERNLLREQPNHVKLPDIIVLKFNPFVCWFFAMG